MASGNFSRFRYALRLVASVFLLSSPCQGAWAQRASTPARSIAEAPAPVASPAIFAGASHPLR
jgi:hypothetical protein